ncbi:MAG: diguanylate cyclase [Thermosulfidibacteraceae bacterium]
MDCARFMRIVGSVLEDVVNDEYVEEIYSTIVEELREIFKPKEIGVVEFLNGGCRFKASRGISYTTIKDIHRKGCHPVFEYVFNSKEITIIKEGHPMFSVTFENPYASMVLIPVVARGVVKSLIFMTFDSDFEMTEEIHQFFWILSNMVGIIVDYYSLKDLIDDMSNYDPLTQVANFKYFHETLYKEWTRAKETNHPFVLALIHVTGIKECNDVLGHVKGDELLKFVAKLVKDSVRSIDFVARYGGAKFVVLFPEMERVDSLKYLNRIKNDFDNSEWTKQSFPVYLDISVSAFPEDGIDEKELLARLEERLVEAMRRKGSDIIYQ